MGRSVPGMVFVKPASATTMNFMTSGMTPAGELALLVRMTSVPAASC